MNALERWHQFTQLQDPALLDEILATDCVFFSPVVHTPQLGQAITKMYLMGAMYVFLDDFHYVKEIVDGNQAVLEFSCEIDGISVNGIDLISFDGDGKIREFKVMVRPLKAINMLHQKMGEMLQNLANEEARN
ncbi:MAG: nuclear transport factor 2 family protein [Cyanobacteria bacterium P01_F01_bin.3]